MYAKIENGEVVQYPVSGTDIRRANPNISFPSGPFSDAMMVEYGCVRVVAVQQPEYDPNLSRAVELSPERVRSRNEDGTFVADNPDTPENEAYVWQQRWEVVPISDAERIERMKAAREIEVANIKVTTQSGNTFDGDEKSQDRMSRAINAMDDSDTTLWVLADNTPTYVTRAELREALRLAGEAQTAVWVRPYQ